MGKEIYVFYVEHEENPVTYLWTDGDYIYVFRVDKDLSEEERKLKNLTSKLKVFISD